MITSIRFFLLHLLAVWAFACTGDSDFGSMDEYEQSIDNEHVKSVSSNGQVRAQYLYDNAGKLREVKGMYSYQRYLYDNNRLIKVEYAVDDAVDDKAPTSSFQPPKEIIPSGNYVIKHYQLFKYDNQKRLSKVENYFMMNGKKFELRSINTFEYEGELIIKENLCDETGKINQYYTFAYDKNGNRTKERYNVCIFDGSPSNPKLYYEKTYKYDNYKNPYQILNIVGPSFYTSANNMIEMTTVWYTNDPRTEKVTQSFEYNSNSYPVKMKYDGGVEEYGY